MLVLAASFATAQVKEQWIASLPGSVSWQQVTPSGTYLVGTSETLAGVNTQTGKINWQLPKFGGTQEQLVKQVGSSPLISITNNGTIYMVDPFTGSIKFDSKKAGVAEIIDRFILYNVPS